MTAIATDLASAPASGRPPRRRRRIGAKARTGLLFGYLVLIALALIYIYPFIISISASLKTDAEATQNALGIIPQTVTFAAYERLFGDVPFPLWAGNTLLVSTIVTIGRVFTDTFAGIAPASVLPFLAAQILGATIAVVTAVFLFTAPAPAGPHPAAAVSKESLA